jgi:hypothetical protein
VEIPRREAQKLIGLATAGDEQCVVIVHDIRRADRARRVDPSVNSRIRSRLFPLGFKDSSKRELS